MAEADATQAPAPGSSSTEVDPSPEPTVAEIVEHARRVRAAGNRAGAAEILDQAIRSGQWRNGKLWSELLSLMERPSDYEVLRELWLASPRGCHARLAILRSVARAASAAGQHDEARALLRKAIITQARYRRRPRAVLGRAKSRLVSRLPHPVKVSSGIGTVSFDKRAVVALNDLNVELDKLGVKAFLISGTLLGYLRDGNFIPWDKDIDVGVLTASIQPSALEHAFDRSTEFLVRRLDFNAERLRVNHVNGIMIDIFPHYAGSDGKVWHDGTATRWWNSPFDLTEIGFLGTRQFVPSDPERYLDENYGSWRVPDPNFDARLDAPNAEVTDQAYLDTLQYFALLDAVVRGNRVKRQRYVGLLRELGERDWLDHL